MTSRPLCQPIVSPEKRLAAERERNRRFWEDKAYIPKNLRVTNATMPTDAPWALFTPPAREDGEDHRRYPSKIGDRSVYLDEWGPQSLQATSTSQNPAACGQKSKRITSNAEPPARH